MFSNNPNQKIDNLSKQIPALNKIPYEGRLKVPNPLDFINDQQFADDEKCTEIINKIFEANKIVVFPEMRKVDIMNETLDEK